jgi:environmental stress-induced protein Ves
MGLPLIRLSLQTLPRERWRNGMGWTRAVQQQGEGDGLRWRVSLAEIGQAAPFSLFEGLDRTTVLVKGGPVLLHGRDDGPLGAQTAHKADEQWLLRDLGDQARYPGELPLANAQPGSAALFWNVMVRREVVQATVRAHGHGALGLPTEGHSLVWVLRGAYELGSLRFEADEGFSLAASGSIAQLRPLTADALLIHTHLIG